MKRSSHWQGDQSSKRLRPLKHHGLRQKQAGWMFAHACPQDPALVDVQLRRSLLHILLAAGFEGVRNDALEGLRMLVEEYMRHFLMQVKHSMQTSRRLIPQPLDFSRALSRFGHTGSAFEEDLRLDAPPHIFQPSLQPPTKLEISTAALDTFGADIDGTADRVVRRWVPRHFPVLPAPHSYKDTAIIAVRESDARKVRELATKEGMQAEQALRRLMIARQDGSRSRQRHSSRLNDKSDAGQSSVFFKDAMNALTREDTEALLREQLESGGLAGEASETSHAPLPPTDIDFGAIVNYDKANWRKRATAI